MYFVEIILLNSHSLFIYKPSFFGYFIYYMYLLLFIRTLKDVNEHV